MRMTDHTFDAYILREYDIRGTYGQSLTGNDALLLGQKLGTLWKTQGISLVCIGRDGRLSSPPLHQHLVQGLREAGMNILDVGVGPTPMVYFAVQETPAQAGIMITGSHNPQDDNGFKMTLEDGPFFGQDIQNLQNQPIHLTRNHGFLEHIDVRETYIQRLLQGYGQRQKNLTIAWDPGNGAASEIVTLLTHVLPGQHHIINGTIDGTFPAHHPDPTEEKNLTQLRQLVQDHQCDIGIAFDGDGDRIGVIDRKGRIVWGDQLLTLLGRDLLQHHPGAVMIADVKSSQGFFNEIEKAGGKPIMGQTGHSLIKKKMKETDALLAGEMSGHIFFADDYYGYDDALYAAIRVLRMIENSPLSLDELYDQLPKFMATPEMRIPCPDALKFTVINQIAHDLKQQGVPFNDTDGVRVQTNEGWWLLRASNTQPVLVGRCEAQTSDGLACLQRQLNEQVQKFLP